MRLLRKISSRAACFVPVVGSFAYALEPPTLENNPFARPQMSSLSVPRNSTGNRPPSGDGLQLTATMVSGKTRFANVNGRILSEGDNVIDYVVKRVFEDRVLFTRNDQDVLVYVKPQSDEPNEESVANR